MFKKLFLLMLAGMVASCSTYDTAGEDSIFEDDFSRHIQVLSADDFEGRSPSGVGEEKTINYLKAEFEKLGLEPGNGDSYFQEVPLVEITANPNTKLAIRGNGQNNSFAYGNEFMAWTKRVVGNTAIRNSEMVFVGYGTEAPEYDWNDYEGLDLSGKTVMMLVNDPGYATQNDELFNGNSMTYYGRWTYKYEEAARQNAAGAIVIHETAPAGYPWAVVQGSWSGPQFDLVSDDNNMSRCAIEGWVTIESANKIFAQAGLDLESLKTEATKPGFKAVPMGLTASLSLSNDIKQSTSNNFIAVLPGSDRSDEYVFYVAHWDHLGLDPNLDGDQIYNGAFDNATGTSGLIEIAEGFTKLSKRPARSIAFLAVTAEEQGLLGSKYYATNPIFPYTKTVASINMDGMNILGKMKDITIVGYGNSELDDYVIAAAKEQNRTVNPDPSPEKGFFYRSDHFSFAKEGIPSLYTDQGEDHVEHGKEWTKEQMADYTANRYHKPADEYNPDWDFAGAIDDLKLLFKVGYRLANETSWPNWREGNEFKAKRDADMAAAEK